MSKKLKHAASRSLKLAQENERLRAEIYDLKQREHYLEEVIAAQRKRENRMGEHICASLMAALIQINPQLGDKDRPQEAAERLADTTAICASALIKRMQKGIA